MTLKEWRKKQGISHYTLGTMLGIRSINPATNSQRYSWCEDTGYLLYKDQKKLIIFASHSFDDDGTLTVGNTTTYPRSVVKKIEVLNDKR